MNSNMQYLAIDEQHPDAALHIAQCRIPEISATQVLVKVSAFGVNRADLLQRAGHYPPPSGESDILGLEVCGSIVSLGEQVTGWQPGERVCAIVAGGGYAQYIAIEASHLMRVPDNLSDAEGAGLAEVFLTAFQAMRSIAKLQQGQKALIHAGASGVGIAATQLCRLWGVETAVTASSAEKLAVCEAQGASLLINYTEQDFVSEIRQHWPAGVNAVLDMVAGDYVNRNLNVMSMDGIMVYLAMMGGRFAEKLDVAKLLAKRVTITGSTLRNRSTEYKAQLVAAFTQSCLPAFASGELQVVIDRVYGVEDINACHATMQRNATMGKLVVSWS